MSFINLNDTVEFSDAESRERPRKPGSLDNHGFSAEPEMNFGFGSEFQP